ncbi:MAG: lycopene cyclase domain-containing protein [Pseudolysinimonas sp.]
MNFLYLIGLLVGLAGMVVLDLRYRLFFRKAPLRAAIVLAVGVAFFMTWDAAGIGLGIFFRGDPALLVGVQLAPELPLEELFFLTLLCYLTMNLAAAATRWLGSRHSRRIETGPTR